MQDHMSAKQYREQVIEPALQEEKDDQAFIKKVVGVNSKIKNVPLEKDIQVAILDRLGLVRGGFFWRENSGMVRSEYGGKIRHWRAGIKGISDIMGVYKGYLVAIEVKRPGKKLSLFQQAFMNRVRDCGGIAFVCDDDHKVIGLLHDYVSSKSDSNDTC